MVPAGPTPDDRVKQTAGFESTGSEPGGSARRKINSVYEFKLNKLRNAFIHDRPHTTHTTRYAQQNGIV